MKVSVRSKLKKKRPGHNSLRQDALELMRALGLVRAELDIELIGRVGIKTLNRGYRGIDKPTDVLSFPVHESAAEFPREGAILLGDIVICPDVALAQAKEYGVTHTHRMRELLVHGLLHLLGHDHEAGAYRARKMRKMESALVCLLEEKA